jgi:hypothetical protein
MHCTLLISRLILPPDIAAEAGRKLASSSLLKVMARSRREEFAPISSEGWLCQAYEVERQLDWPVAPLTLALDGGEADAHYWLRADPVHLRVNRDRLVLVGSNDLALAPDEASALVAALNAHFNEDGHAFTAGAPQRWYLRCPRMPDMTTVPVDEAAGNDVHQFLPQGGDAAQFRRLFNEVQMLLHAHPVNEAREARGAPPVNSVWFWGGGAKTPVPGRPYTAVWSAAPLAQALATAAGDEALPVPAQADEWLASSARFSDQGARALITLEALDEAVRYGDLGAWRAAFDTLDRNWVAPLEAALRKGQLTSLTLIAPAPRACVRFHLTRAALYACWRRPRPLAAYSR